MANSDSSESFDKLVLVVDKLSELSADSGSRLDTAVNINSVAADNRLKNRLKRLCAVHVCDAAHTGSNNEKGIKRVNAN